MPFFFFAVAARSQSPAHEELNNLLQSQKVLSLDRRFVEAGDNSYWAVCVECLNARPGAGSGTAAERSGVKAASPSRENQIDYRDVLTSEQFAVYSELRKLRVRVAEEEGVKLFVIFTNRQLAEMVINRASTKADLAKISGVGEAATHLSGRVIFPSFWRIPVVQADWADLRDRATGDSLNSFMFRGRIARLNGKSWSRVRDVVSRGPSRAWVQVGVPSCVLC